MRDVRAGMTFARILVIRRDNIGDLICTLPLLAALRQTLPDAAIDVLANSYNAPLLTAITDVRTVYRYTKAKHVPGENRLRVARAQAALLLALRRQHYDAALVASGGGHRLETRLWLRALGARTTVARDDSRGGHEVERVLALGEALGLTLPRLPLRLPPDPARLTLARDALQRDGVGPIGLHISARESENRWPPDRFVELIRRGAARGLRFALFWSPGPADRPQHPGDDETAARILTAAAGLPVMGWPTESLHDLAAALACCERVVGSDGGHCHIAAAVGTPVVGLYCHHKVEQWRPWGTAHTVLSGRRVDAIPVEQVFDALVTGTGHLAAIDQRRDG